MQKKYAMSNMGYAIVLVIILGVFMIISAPMIMDNYKNDNKNTQNNENSYESSQNDDYDEREDRHGRDRRHEVYNRSEMVNLMDEIRNLENRFDSRLNELEAGQREIRENSYNSSETNTVSDKFVCSIEGSVDSDGNFVSLDNRAAVQDIKKQKIVFVCEYKE